MFGILLYAACSALRAALVLWFLFAVLERRYPWNKTILIAGTVVVVCTAGSLLTPPHLGGLWLLLSVVCVLALLTKGSRSQMLLAGIALAAVLITVEMLLILIAPTFTSASAVEFAVDDGRLMLARALYFPTTALLLFGTAGFIRRCHIPYMAREWRAFWVFPLCQFFYALLFFYFHFSGNIQNSVGLQVAILSVSLLTDFVLFSTLRNIAQRNSLTAQNEALGSQLELQKIHYAALTEQYEAVRRMRRDIAAHMNMVRTLIESGEQGQAASYVEELSQQTYRPGLGQCKNPVVDAFLTNRLKELSAAGVRTEFSATLPDRLQITNVDLVIALGNLLDNALDACRGVEESQVILRAAVKAGYLVIDLGNSARPAAGARKRRIPELERGIGFEILQDLADKYNGSFVHERRNGWFHAVLTLESEVTAPCCE